MKKLMLAFAVLTVLTITLVSFTKSELPKNEKQSTYVWIKYNCGSFGSATVVTTSMGGNRHVTSDPSYPTSWSDPIFNGCQSIVTPKICAVRFLLSEIEPMPCCSGHAQPKAGVNPWNGTRMLSYCN